MEARGIPGGSDTTDHMEGAALNAFSADIDPQDEDGYCLYVMAFLAKAQPGAGQEAGRPLPFP